MFCTQCGNTTADGARVCAHCGVSLDAPAQPIEAPPVVASAAPAVPAQATPIVAEVRPWVRYWARTFDMSLAGIVGGFAVGVFNVFNPGAYDLTGLTPLSPQEVDVFNVFNPDAYNESDSEQDLLFGLVVVFAWVFIESLFLSIAGTTPGKWLFKTRLIPPSGEKPDYSTALSRSFKVWWRGLGIGFPLVTLITVLVAHGKLTKNGTTTWDRDDGFTVVHERIGPLRVIVAVIFFGFLLLCAAMP